MCNLLKIKSRIQKLKYVINHVTRVINKPKLNQAIGDMGTTGNFVRAGTPVDDIKVAINPIEIEMPNGSIEKSTQRATCGSQDCPKK